MKARPDLTAQFDTHRSYLLRVARLQLRNDELAEDVVQDTLVAALQGAAGFTGKSSVKTWLTGILKHKIVDAIRRKASNPELVMQDEDFRVDDLDALFDETGHWDSKPATWGNPEADFEQPRNIVSIQLSPRSVGSERTEPHDGCRKYSG